VKPVSCSQEQAVARAVGTGSWTEALAAHAEACAICGDVAQTAHWLRAIANAPHETDVSGISQQTRALPDPGLVWWRARLEKEHAKKSGKVLEWVQMGSSVVAPLALAGWIVWNWYPIEVMAGQFLLSAWPQLSVAIFVLASMAPAALIIAALALGYPLLSDE
jgi:hypothetical protein